MKLETLKDLLSETDRKLALEVFFDVTVIYGKLALFQNCYPSISALSIRFLRNRLLNKMIALIGFFCRFFGTFSPNRKTLCEALLNVACSREFRERFVSYEDVSRATSSGFHTAVPIN